MAFIKRRAKFIGRNVQIFREEQEQWKADHDQAQASFELEELLGDGAELYEKICRLDECWHLAVFENPKTFDQETNDEIHGLFQHWFDTTTHVLDLTREMQADYAARGFDMNRIRELSASHHACQAILNPSEVETELADAAVQVHRTGHTEEF